MSVWNLIHDGAIPDLDPMQRSHGLHVSSAIRRMAIERGDFEDTPESEFSKPHIANRMALGNAFETGLISMLTKSDPLRYFAGFEIECGDQLAQTVAYGTHDIIDVVDRVVWECKVTWMGAKRDVDDSKFRKFEEQLMCYVHNMSDTFLVRRLDRLRQLAADARTEWDELTYYAEAIRLEVAINNMSSGRWRTGGLWVVYVNGYNLFWLDKLGWGRYSRKQIDDDGPVSRQWIREFEQSELVENWARVSYELKQIEQERSE